MTQKQEVSLNTKSVENESGRSSIPSFPRRWESRNADSESGYSPIPSFPRRRESSNTQFHFSSQVIHNKISMGFCMFVQYIKHRRPLLHGT